MDEQPPKRPITLWDKTKPWYQNLIPQGSIPSWFFLLLILFSAAAYHYDTATYREVYENPCNYCTSCQEANLPSRVPLQPINTENTITWQINTS